MLKANLRYLEDPQLKYRTWLEVQIETDKHIPLLEEQLNSLKATKPFIEKLCFKQSILKAHQNLDQLAEEALALNDLDPKAVFIKRCEAEYGDEDFADLLVSFNEVIEQMTQLET